MTRNLSCACLLFVALLLLSLAGDPVAKADGPGAVSRLPPIRSSRAADIETLREGFAAPPREAGPWVYWFFFDNVLSPEEITRELEELAAAGFAGAELRFVSMHGFEGTPGPWFDQQGWARLGLERLEFLSPKFVDALEHACAEAQRLGLQLSINTGMGWPPGGPWIPPEHRSRHLAWQAREISGPAAFVDRGLPPDSMVLAWRLAPGGDGKAVEPGSFHSLTDTIRWQDGRGEVQWDVPAGRWLIGSFRVTPGGLCDKGNGPEVDPGSREAVLFHLEHVFSRLDPKLAKYYRTTLVDVTTDSWEYARGGNRYWSPAIVDTFARLAGYDVREKMHALLGYGPDLREVVTDLEAAERAVVRENFHQTFTRFVNDRGLQHRAQVRGRGLERDFFEVYAESDIPEVEEEVYLPGAVWTAHTLGKPIITAEAFTFVSGHGRNLERDGQSRGHEGPLIDPGRLWETNPAQLRWHANAFYARGINRLVGGLFPFSPSGVPLPGWRMYAEVHLGRSDPWWPAMPSYTVWAARMQWVLQSGMPVADALVYPVRSNLPDGPYNQATDQPVSASDAIDGANASTLRRQQSEPRYEVARLVVIGDVPTAEEAGRILQLVTDGTTLVCCHSLPEAWSACRDPVVRETLRPAIAAAVGRGKLVDARDRGWREALADARSVGWLPASANLSFQHRRVAGGEIYLLTNWGERFSGEVSFPHADLVPEIWDADRGTSLPAGQYRVAEGRTAVAIALEPHEAAVVVFTRAAPAVHAVRCEGGRVARDPDGAFRVQLDGAGPCRVELSDGQVRELQAAVPEPIALDEGWTLAADPDRGIGLPAPAPVTLESLGSWREVPGWRTYAGTGRYETSFELPAELVRDDIGLLLELGTVHELADVQVNGRKAGTAWFPPFVIDLTGHVRPGRNLLRIDVPNLLKNHLEPGDYRRPSGLVGPVRIRPVQRALLSAEPP
jgi:hypothetical protein